MVLAALLAGMAVSEWHAQAHARQILPIDWQSQPLTLDGTVSSVPQYSPDGVRFEFEITKDSIATLMASSVFVPGHLPPRRLLLGWYVHSVDSPKTPGQAPVVRAGERWRLEVRLKRPHGLLNPHGFDRELYLFEQGIHASGSVRRGERLGVDAAYRIERWRQSVRDAIFQALDDSRIAGILAALTVGDQGAIKTGDWDVFRVSGVAHLMSISGLHVTMFAWLAGSLIRRIWSQNQRAMLWIPAPVVARWGGMLAAFIYALLSGWGVPAQRTVYMLGVVTLMSYCNRRWPWTWILLAAAVVVTSMDPLALLQAGFWLSFTAVALLMISAQSENFPTHSKGWRGWISQLGGHVVQGARTQWLATWGLTPLSLVIFQQFSLVGFLANLIAIPVVTLIVTPLAMLGVLWPEFWFAGAWVLEQLMAYLQSLAAWPWAVWVAPAAPVWAQFLGLLAAIIWMTPSPWALRSLGGVLVLPLLAFVPEKPPKGEFDMLALDVGQGTSVLIQTQNHQLLFDTGPWYSPESNAGQRVVIPVLHALGHSHLDLLVLSHRDLDHVGGAQSLLRQVPVANILSSLEPTHFLHQEATANRIPSLRCEAGQYWIWDHVRFEVLHPHTDDYSRMLKSNAMSCVIKISAKNQSVMLTGDIEGIQERTLVRNYGPELKSTVLLVPHHGSKTSSLPEFLASVQPSVAVIQAGYKNHYGHPAPTVINRYQEQGIALISTMACGSWRWKSLEAPTLTQCERELRRRYWHSSEGWPKAKEMLHAGELVSSKAAD